MVPACLPSLLAGALQPLQGVVVPEVLGWGHLMAGIYCLVTTRVDGVPLSQLSNVPDEVAAAAERALQQVCSVLPGFLHGDLRKPNIMLHHKPDDTAPPKVFLLDFAASRLDGLPAEVAAQKKEAQVHAAPSVKVHAAPSVKV